MQQEKNNDIIKKGEAVVSNSEQSSDIGQMHDAHVQDARAQTFWGRMLEFLEVHKSAHDESIRETFLFNHDLKPVESKRRVWSWFNFVYFWIADCFNINTWQVAATGLQLGLTWWQTWLTVWVGYTIIALFVVAVARIGSVYHVSFPIAARASFGVFFSLWPVLNSCLLYTSRCV